MVSRGTTACLLLVVGLAGCDQSPTAPTPTPTTPTVPVIPSDFDGHILIPIHGDQMGDIRRWNQPIQGVGVTIVTGPRTGERVETDQDGRYSFPEFDGDEIHLRLEKNGYEPKEAIVHRTRPTMPDRVPLSYNGPQDTPGTVLIGLRWPGYIRPLMQQMEVMPDLLLMSFEAYGTDGGGYYGHGLIAVSDLQWIDVMIHEVCHAHQNLVADVSGGSDGWWSPRWDASPEGQAYMEATTADINEVGRDVFDASHRVKEGLVPGNVLVEGAAEACASFWMDRYNYNHEWSRKDAPNRFIWAEEWLPR